MNELVGGLGYAVKLVDVPVAGLALHCGSTMLIVRSCEQLCGTECHLQYLDSGQWRSGSFAAGNKKTISSWGWYLAGGIIDLLIGIYLVFYPLVSMELIPFIVALWLMFRGFTLCGYSTDLKRYGTKDWGGIWCLAFWLFFALWLSSGNLDLVLLPCSICCPSLSLLSDVSVSFSPSS